MPTVKIRIPVSTGSGSFVRRAKVRAGLGGLLIRSKVALPGPNVFSGMGAFFQPANVVFPGQNVFPPSIARGVGSMLVQAPRPPLPGVNVFSPFLRGAKHCAVPCPCQKPCRKFRRGIGQDDEYTGDPIDFNSAPLETSLPLLGQSDAASALPSVVTYSPTSGWDTTANFDVASEPGSTSSTFNPLQTVGASTPSSAWGSPVTSATTLPASSGTFNPLQTVSSTSSLSAWLSANMGTVLLGGGALVAVALIANQKKKR